LSKKEKRESEPLLRGEKTFEAVKKKFKTRGIGEPKKVKMRKGPKEYFTP